MNTIKLVIADANQPYVMSLSQYLQDEYGQALELTYFTQPSLLEAYISECKDMDILLLDEIFAQRINHIHKPGMVVILSEQQGIEGQSHQIYKYQKADAIGKQLMEILDQGSNKTITLTKRKGQGKIIGVYSPEGAAGKSTVAFHLAQQYALNARKVLYLSFESFSSLSIFKEKEGAYGATYLLHLLKNKASNAQLKLNAMKCVDGDTQIHFLPRESNVLEYKDLKREDVEQLLEFLRTQSGYDAVIADFDSALNDTLLGAMKKSDALLNVISGDPAMKDKHLEFFQCISKLEDLLGADLEDKLVLVYNKGCKPGCLAAMQAESAIPYVEIPYIEQFDTTYRRSFKDLYGLLENETYE